MDSRADLQTLFTGYLINRLHPGLSPTKYNTRERDSIGLGQPGLGLRWAELVTILTYRPNCTPGGPGTMEYRDPRLRQRLHGAIPMSVGRRANSPGAEGL